MRNESLNSSIQSGEVISSLGVAPVGLGFKPACRFPQLPFLLALEQVEGPGALGGREINGPLEVVLRIPKNSPSAGTLGFLGSGPRALYRILDAGCESVALLTSARTGRCGRVTGQEGCGPHPPSALSLPLSETLPLA